MFNRQSPQLSGDEIAELVQMSEKYLALLENINKNNYKSNQRAHSMWDSSSNLQRWFRGESVYSIDDNQQPSISDDTLLIHLNTAIASEHNTYFKNIFNDNQRLHALIQTLPTDQSAALLVKMCRAYRRHGNENIISVMQLMKGDAIKQALTTLQTMNAEMPRKYLADRITLLQSHTPSVIIRFTSSYPSFFTPAAAATITTLPEPLPVADFDMPDASSEWDQDLFSTPAKIPELELTDADLQEWLDTIDDEKPGMRM